VSLALALAGGLSVSLATASAPEVCRDYECVAIIETDVPCISSFARVTPAAINSAMTVVGKIECITSQTPFRWTPEEGLEFIDIPDMVSGALEDINESGVAVGWAGVSGVGQVGVIVMADGTVETVSAPPGWGYLFFSAINESGDIAGTVTPPASSAASPVLYDPATATFEVFPHPPDTISWAVSGITEDRTILGSVQRLDPISLDGAMLRDGVVELLETDPDARFAVVEGMSVNGVISGYGFASTTSPARPLAWNEDGALIPIQGDPSGRSAAVRGVAPDGWRVGGWQRDGGDNITTTWRPDGWIFAIEPDDRACGFGDLDEAVDMAAGGLLVAEAVHAETNAAVAVVLRAVDAGTAPADLDCDGAVGFSDLLYVLWASQTAHETVADVDGDGDVNFGDILFVVQSWTR